MTEKKVFNKFYAQSLKLKAASIDPFVKKKEALLEKKANIEAEYKAKMEAAIANLDIQIETLQKSIDAVDNIVKEETGGYGILELLHKEGRAWVLNYPDTVVPVNEETCECNNSTSVEEVTGNVDTETGEITPETTEMQEHNENNGIWN